MKTFLVVFILLIINLNTLAQWSTSGTNIYNSNAGFVGINTLIPQYRLDVVGDIRGRYNLFTTGVGTGNGYIADDGAGSTIFSITRQENNETRFQSYGPITFRTHYSTGTERMRITESGDVGIGTLTPAARLEVNGSLNVGVNGTAQTGYGSSLSFLGASLNGDALWISRYNNGDNKSELRLNIGDDYGQNEDMFVVGTHYWSNGLWYPHLSVHASGRVGIGTTEPDYKLTLNGGIRAFIDDSGDIANLRGPRILTSALQGLNVIATSTNASKVVWGVVGQATSSYNQPNTATAIGVYGEAASPSGGYAGWFNGDLAYSGNFGKPSDRNLKENIEELPTAIDLMNENQA